MTAHAACHKAKAPEAATGDGKGANAQPQTRRKQELVAAADREASLRLQERRVVGLAWQGEEGGGTVRTRAGYGQA
jgi:hypothetical protein